MIGGSLWIDRSDPVLGKVTGKFEGVHYSFVPQGAWYRLYQVGVEFMTADNRPGSALIRVPEDRFDALALGDTMSVRYFEAFPLVGRSADRTTMDVVRELGHRAATDKVLAPLLLWLVGGVVVLWVASRIGMAAIVVAGVAWTAAAFPLLFPAAAPVQLPPGEAQARVAVISLVERAPERRTTRTRGRSFTSIRRLDVPYHIVQLRVPLAGRGDSVLAVDAVDTGSVSGLAHGAVLPVRLDARSPRDARLAQGERTFMVRNRYHFLVPIVGFGVLLTLGAMGWRSRRARATASAGNAGA